MKKEVYVKYLGLPAIVEAFGRMGYSNNLSPDANPELALFCMNDLIKTPFSALRLKSWLNRKNIPLIVWNRDGPANRGDKVWRLWLLKNAPFFDIYASHTHQEATEFSSSPIYLPNAADIHRYNLAGVELSALRDVDRYEWDVCFFGTINADKYPEHRRREEFLNELAKRLSARGVRCCFTDKKLSTSEQVHLIQTSIINLNVHAGADSCYNKRQKIRWDMSWGLPERCYGIPACGGFLLSDARPCGEEDYPDGLWQQFVSMDDAVTKIEYFLSNFQLTRQIAEAQHHRVIAYHTYDHRAQALLDAASEWRSRKNR